MVCFKKYLDLSQKLDRKIENMKKSKTVILWGQSGLHVFGIEAYLNRQNGWEVYRVSKQQGFECLLQKVEEVKPVVVILFEDDCASTKQLLLMLLEVQPDLRVITMTLSNNTVEVFDSRKVEFKEGFDFITLINSFTKAAG